MNKLLLYLFVLYSTSFLAQNRAGICFFGNAALDFSTFPPQAITTSAMNGTESPASICDERGNLLFYSNGGDSPLVPSVQGGIWNKNNVLMENGDLTNLGGCISSYYGATIIPMDDDISTEYCGLYYLITNDCVESGFTSGHYNEGLSYCVVDMSYNGGLGKVISKNNIVLPFSGAAGSSTYREPIAAIVHANQKDYWIFGYHNDSLYSIKASINGFSNYHSYFKAQDRMTIAPSGEFIVCNKVLYQLDDNTADLITLFNLNSNNCAFSSNGNVLYVLDGQNLYQYDLSSQSPQATKTYIATIGNSCKLVLASDYRIYFFTPDSGSFPGCINCPNTLGMACNVNYQSIGLAGKNSQDEFTNIPANFLYKTGKPCLLSIDENKNQEDCTVYPNPTKGFVNIRFNISSFESVEIRSVEGKILKTIDVKDQKSIQVPLTSFDSGLYWLYFINEKGFYSKKILKL